MNLNEEVEAVSVSSSKKNFLQILFVLILINFVSNVLIAQNNKTFTVGTIEAEPSKTVSGNLIVEDAIDKGTIIPIILLVR